MVPSVGDRLLLDTRGAVDASLLGQHLLWIASDGRDLGLGFAIFQGGVVTASVSEGKLSVETSQVAWETHMGWMWIPEVLGLPVSWPSLWIKSFSSSGVMSWLRNTQTPR